MISSNSGTDCSAEMRIAFKWKIEHKIDVERPRKPFRLYCVRLIIPTCIAELNEKMVIGAIGKIELLFLFWWCYL